MFEMRRLRPLFLALATTLVAAPPRMPRHADRPRPGIKPSVVVDPAGTSHILFLPDTFGVPQYYRLPRARRPATSAPRSTDLDDFEQVSILRRDGDGVLIAVARDTNKPWLAYSSDSGASFVPAGFNAAEVGLAGR